MKVHVIGASGFLGRHVLAILVARGHETTALARSASSADRVARLGARPIMADASHQRSLEAAVAASESDALLCLVPLSSGLGPGIVTAGEKAGMERAAFVSTTAIFTTLDAANTAARQRAEAVIQASSMAWTIVRPTMIYGEPGDRNLERLLRLLRRTPVLPVPQTTGRQQPVHVEDCATAVVAALERPLAAGRGYQVAGPAPLSLWELVTQAAAAVDRPTLLVPIPMAPVTALARLYERVAAHPRFRAENLARVAEDKAFDNGPARQDLGHNPRSFALGVAQEVALMGRGRLPAASGGAQTR